MGQLWYAFLSLSANVPSQNCDITMANWTFLNYIGSDGTNYFRAWLDSLSLRVRMKINTRIQYLAQLPGNSLPSQYTRKLTGTDGLYEIRVTHENKQWRPIFCYGPNRGQITILAGAVERGSEFEPKTVLKTASQRKKHIAVEGRTREHSIEEPDGRH